jgi:hypothetical protein
MKLWIKFLLFLIPAVAGTIFVFWRFSPEQAIIKRADVLFTSLEKKTLSSGTPREKAARFQEILSPQLEIKAPFPIPSGKVPPATAAYHLKQFQGGVTSCKIARKDETVAFPSEGMAIYQSTVVADISAGPNSQRVLRYRCRLEFEKSGRDWLLRSIVLTPI